MKEQSRLSRVLEEAPIVAIVLSLLVLAMGFVAPFVIGMALKSKSKPAEKPPQLWADDYEKSSIAEEKKKAPQGFAAGISTGPSAAVAGNSAPASVELGERTFNTYCVACHQESGVGKVGFAPYIRHPQFLALASDEYLRDSIVGGRPGTAMTSWAHLPVNEVESLVAYLRAGEDENSTFQKADPGKNYPGDPTEGEHLYSVYCSSCHGVNATGYAEGGSGPGIGNEGFLAVASDDFIFQTVKHGRIGTSMRSFVGARGLANLTEKEVGNIIAYLRNRGPVAEVAVKEGDPKAGKMHFDANCMACHQTEGKGLTGMAPSIRNRDFLALASPEFIRKTIREGRPGTAMVQRPDLSAQSVEDIIAYLYALPGGPNPDIKVDPSKDLASKGDAEAGARTYSVYCASCHGAKGGGYVAGGPGTAIGLEGFLKNASDDYIFQTMKMGRIGTPMRAFIGARGLANLSEQDAYDVIAYLRSLSASAN